ncbi:hypothetical protein MMC22_010290 [Lobaria immixta]|nr:hypothetical protein [Lobaria immixta]
MSTLHIDPASLEGSASQVLGTASGEVNTSGQNAADPPRRSSRGGVTTTTQTRLYPPTPGRDPLLTTPIQDAVSNSMELDSFGETVNVARSLPVDTGFGAWSYVAAAFSMFVVVWGFPQSFPIFQTYLAAKYPNSEILLLLSPGLQDIEEGILFQILPKSAKYRQLMVIIGIFTMIVALLLASSANNPWQILCTQGLLFGFGGILLNFVHISIFSEWFEKKKKWAMTIIWLGYRTGALAFTPASQWLLEKHGYEKTLRVLIPPMLTLLIPSVALLRGRHEPASVVTEPIRPNLSKLAVLRNPDILFYLLVAFLFFSIVNVPRTFMAIFGNDINLETSDTALVLFVHVLCNMIATYSLGWLSESMSHDGLIAGCAISTSLVHLLVWGTSKSKFGLFLYAIASGLTSGGNFASMLSK